MNYINVVFSRKDKHTLYKEKVVSFFDIKIIIFFISRFFTHYKLSKFESPKLQKKFNQNMYFMNMVIFFMEMAAR